MHALARPRTVGIGIDYTFWFRHGDKLIAHFTNGLQSMENLWLAWAKRLQAIASTGMHYTVGVYDKDRYAEIAAIAHDMLAALANVPVSRIHNLVSDFAKGYSTPLVDVRAAVFCEHKILLVKEMSDGLW